MLLEIFGTFFSGSIKYLFCLECSKIIHLCIRESRYILRRKALDTLEDPHPIFKGGQPLEATTRKTDLKINSPALKDLLE